MKYSVSLPPRPTFSYVLCVTFILAMTWMPLSYGLETIENSQVVSKDNGSRQKAKQMTHKPKKAKEKRSPSPKPKQLEPSSIGIASPGATNE